ncbi:MAG: phosphate ABC transporter permease subunit PstC, partial [Gammaproteobacteria bacterium]|nr:phosphate ABC transporter permease subunit PstC [Gammaproteobacteria bacterium]
MNATNLFFVILGLTVVSYVFAQRKAISACGGHDQIRKLHSLPSYYGSYTALWCALPALLLLLVWNLTQPAVISQIIANDMPQKYHDLGAARLALVVNDVINIATGGITNNDTPEADIQTAAAHYTSLTSLAASLQTLVILILAAALSLLAYRRIDAQFRARNHVERAIRYILIACSSIAILTTFGIFLSVFFESIRFFQMIPMGDFLFGLHWSPQT